MYRVVGVEHETNRGDKLVAVDMKLLFDVAAPLGRELPMVDLWDSTPPQQPEQPQPPTTSSTSTATSTSTTSTTSTSTCKMEGSEPAVTSTTSSPEGFIG